MDVLERIELYNKILSLRKDTIISILIKVETKETAVDEWERSKSCFDGLKDQFRYLFAGTVANISSFLPLNQPLYSFFLFVIVPSFTARKVFFRPPVLLWNIFTELVSVFESAMADSVSMCCVTRRSFLEEQVGHSDVVIFTGEYDNALSIKQYLKEGSLLLFNGGALNPIIVTDSVDIDIVVRDVARERLFNSGQDCMAPCGILVNRKISDTFVQHLINRLSSEIAGLNTSPETTVGQMIDSESIIVAQSLIQKYHDYLILGGTSDEVNRIIEPTLFLFPTVKMMPQELIFAPLFFIGIYKDLSEVEAYLSTPIARELSGYVSFYSSIQDDIERIKAIHKQVLVNEGLFVEESANKEFGGYGSHCSFALINGNMTVRPLLISKEIAKAFYSIKDMEEKNGSI